MAVVDILALPQEPEAKIEKTASDPPSLAPPASASGPQQWWRVEEDPSGWLYPKCLLCRKFIDETHLGSSTHQRKMAALTHAAAPPVSEQMGGTPAASAAGPQQWWKFEEDPSGWSRPKCLLCRKFIDEAHLGTSTHQRNVAALTRAAAPPASEQMEGEPFASAAGLQQWWRLEEDPSGWSCPKCLLCSKFIDEKHLSSSVHQRRIASLMHAVAPPALEQVME